MIADFAPALTLVPQYRVLDIETPDDLDYRMLDIEPRIADLGIPSLHVLNLGAGNGTGNFAGQIQNLPVAHLCNVELFDDALWQLSHYPHAAQSVRFAHQDMLEFCRMARDNTYDVILVIDAIEHLTREQGFELLGHLTRIARKRVMLWLPFGKCEQHSYGGNDLQEHQSEWQPHDFVKAVKEPFVVEVDVCWAHYHIKGNPRAGWVVISI